MSTRVEIPTPKARVRLVGLDGNAYAIMSRAKDAMKQAGYSQAVIDAYVAEAMQGDYNHLIRVTVKYCDWD